MRNQGDALFLHVTEKEEVLNNFGRKKEEHDENQQILKEKAQCLGSIVEASASLLKAIGEIMPANPRITKEMLFEECSCFRSQFESAEEYASTLEKLLEFYISIVKWSLPLNE